MNFSIEVAKRDASQDDAEIIARFSTDNVLELSQYIGEAITYFKGMVQFTSVNYVGLLVRCYNDHHVISIRRDRNDKVQVRTNQ